MPPVDYIRVPNAGFVEVTKRRGTAMRTYQMVGAFYLIPRFGEKRLERLVEMASVRP